MLSSTLGKTTTPDNTGGGDGPEDRSAEMQRSIASSLEADIGWYEAAVRGLRGLIRAAFENGTPLASANAPISSDVRRGVVERGIFDALLSDMGLITLVLEHRHPHACDREEKEEQVDRTAGRRYGFCSKWYLQEILAGLALLMNSMSKQATTRPHAATTCTEWLSKRRGDVRVEIAAGDGGAALYLSDLDRNLCGCLFHALVAGNAPASSAVLLALRPTTTALIAAMLPLASTPHAMPSSPPTIPSSSAVVIGNYPNPHLVESPEGSPDVTSTSPLSGAKVAASHLGEDLFVEAMKTVEGRARVGRFREAISSSLSRVLLDKSDGVFGLIRVLLLDDRVENAFVHEAVRGLVNVVVRGLALRSEDNFKRVCRQVRSVLHMQFSGTGLDGFGRGHVETREEERRRLRLRGIGSEAVIERMLRQREATGGGSGVDELAMEATLGYRLHLALTALCEGLASHGRVRRDDVRPLVGTPSVANVLTPYERLAALNSTLLGPLFAPLSGRRPSNLWMLKECCGAISDADRANILRGTPVVDEVLASLNALHALLVGSSNSTFNVNEVDDTAAAPSGNRRFIAVVLPVVLPSLVAMWNCIYESSPADAPSDSPMGLLTLSEGDIVNGKRWGWYAVETRLRQVWGLLLECPANALSPITDEICLMVGHALTATSSPSDHSQWHLIRRKDSDVVSGSGRDDGWRESDALVVSAPIADIESVLSSCEGALWEPVLWRSQSRQPKACNGYGNISSRGISEGALRALLIPSPPPAALSGATLPAATGAPFLHRLFTLSLEGAVAEAIDASNRRALGETTTTSGFAANTDEESDTECDGSDTSTADLPAPMLSLPAGRKPLIEVISSTTVDNDTTTTSSPPIPTSTSTKARAQRGSRCVSSLQELAVAMLSMVVHEGRAAESVGPLGLLCGYSDPTKWSTATVRTLLKGMNNVATLLAEVVAAAPSRASSTVPARRPLSVLVAVLGSAAAVALRGGEVESGSGTLAFRVVAGSYSSSSEFRGEQSSQGIERVRAIRDQAAALVVALREVLALLETSPSFGASTDESIQIAVSSMRGVLDSTCVACTEFLGAVQGAVGTLEQIQRQEDQFAATSAESDHGCDAVLEHASKVANALSRAVGRLESRGALGSAASPWEASVNMREAAERVEELCDAKEFRGLSSLLSTRDAPSKAIGEVLRRTAVICIRLLVPRASPVMGPLFAGAAGRVAGGPPKPTPSDELFVTTCSIRILSLLLLQRLDGHDGLWLASLVRGCALAALEAARHGAGKGDATPGYSCSFVSAGLNADVVGGGAGGTAPPPSGVSHVSLSVQVAADATRGVTLLPLVTMISHVMPPLGRTAISASNAVPDQQQPPSVVVDTHQASTLLCMLLEVLVCIAELDSIGSTIRMLDAVLRGAGASLTALGVTCPSAAIGKRTSSGVVTVGPLSFVPVVPQASTYCTSLFELLKRCVSLSANRSLDQGGDWDRRLLVSAIYTIGSVAPLLHPRLPITEVLQWVSSELFQGGSHIHSSPRRIPMMARAAAASAVYRIATAIVEQENEEARRTLSDAASTTQVSSRAMAAAGRASGSTIRLAGADRPLLLPTTVDSDCPSATLRVGKAATVRLPSVVSKGRDPGVDSSAMLILRGLRDMGSQLSQYRPSMAARINQPATPRSCFDQGGLNTLANHDDADEHHVEVIRAYGDALTHLMSPP